MEADSTSSAVPLCGICTPVENLPARGSWLFRDGDRNLDLGFGGGRGRMSMAGKVPMGFAHTIAVSMFAKLSSLQERWPGSSGRHVEGVE